MSLPLLIPGAPMQDDKIVGGFPINITQTPWQAALLLASKQFCGGSIISARWILTSAYCLTRKNPMQYQILIGTHIKDRGGKLHNVRDYWIHRQYNSKNFDYDFGLIALKEEIDFTDHVQPIRLPTIKEAHPGDGTVLLVSGWGNTKHVDESDKYLRAVEVPTINQNLCNKAYEAYGGVTDRMFCAGFYEQGGKDG